MRVALVAHWFAEYCVWQASALAEHAEVSLLLPEGLLGSASKVLSPKVRHVSIPKHPSRSLKNLLAVRDLAKLIRAERPDVIFLHANGHARLMLGLPWLKGLPIVATIHDPVPHPGESTWVRRFAGRMLRRRADHFILHGESLCDEYERVWGVPRARMSAIPHGVLAYRAWQDEAVKPPAGRYVLLFGRIRPYKGIPVLIEAARRMRTPPESLQIVIAGRGDDMAPHLDHIERAEQRERFVILNEFLSESMIDALHRHARAVVLPYTQASQSGPAATALEYGQPVIASEIGGLPDVVREGETGLLVPPGDAEALAGALDRIAEDDGLRERLSAGARRVATDELSWKALAGPTMAALKRGIEAHRRGGN